MSIYRRCLDCLFPINGRTKHRRQLLPLPPHPPQFTPVNLNCNRLFSQLTETEVLHHETLSFDNVFLKIEHNQGKMNEAGKKIESGYHLANPTSLALLPFQVSCLAFSTEENGLHLSGVPFPTLSTPTLLSPHLPCHSTTTPFKADSCFLLKVTFSVMNCKRNSTTKVANSK